MIHKIKFINHLKARNLVQNTKKTWKNMEFQTTFTYLVVKFRITSNRNLSYECK